MEDIFKDFSNSAELIGKMMFPEDQGIGKMVKDFTATADIVSKMMNPHSKQPSIFETMQDPLSLFNQFMNPSQ